jgi:hypothetical protein
MQQIRTPSTFDERWASQSAIGGIDPETRRTFEGLLVAFFTGLLFWSVVGVSAL